ncbi:MAG: AMP nucleosidase [Inquilinaceae bacterium]
MDTKTQDYAQDIGAPTLFHDPDEAYRRIVAIYDANTRYLRDRFQHFATSDAVAERVRACYPYVQIRTDTFARVDTRLSYGFVSGPGTYVTTLTRPDMFGSYLLEQLRQLTTNHAVPVEVGVSDVPIPVHFAFPTGLHVEGDLAPGRLSQLREAFDVPDLTMTDDTIVNGTYKPPADAPQPLALFTAPRTDYSLHRLKHYTATSCEHFQNFVLFTNYQFYIDEFTRLAQTRMAKGDPFYEAFVEPGDRFTPNVRLDETGRPNRPVLDRMPQMPAYHLKAKDHAGITMINIGVGPSNAKTITDHVAVLRPYAWLMLGHCAGLRNTQKLGDYVLAHGYVREDHVLDADLPTWIPVPPLAEVQQALEGAVSEITGLKGYELKSVMRTGTVATIDNRNWELRDQREPVQRFSQSRAVALDMESATIAANGFRFRVPYGTLLCVSDKPLHGELKLPGMANAFYKLQVNQHLDIGIRAMEMLRELGLERLHSRKLRSFTEVGFQ